MVDIQNSSISLYRVDKELIRHITQVFPFQSIDLQIGFKYLGFFINPNDYEKNDGNGMMEMD